MTTYREAIYMCLDLLKGMSDDFTYTEDHVAYLLDKFRAYLLKQRYGNDPKKHVPYSNYQNIEVTFNNTKQYKKIIKSDNTIPNMLQLGIPRITIENEYYYNYKFELTSRERLPFTGDNKFTSMINYCAINEDNHVLYATKENQWSKEGKINPSSFTITAIFENPREVEAMDLDSNIPLEETLITTLIEMVVKELAGSMYIPTDDVNNNRDDKASLANVIQTNMKSNFAKQLEK
jgi:hypothetical protein